MAAEPGLDVLVVDDDAGIRKTLAYCLEGLGHRPVTASTQAEALRVLQTRRFAVAFLDLRLGTEEGLEVLPRLLAHAPRLKVIVITAHAALQTAVESLRRGAVDYLPKPFTPAQVELALERLRETLRLEGHVVRLEHAATNPAPLIFESQNSAMQALLAQAWRVAETDATMLLTGESGTGKSALAAAIHACSPRRREPFAVVSAPSVPTELLEADLFGHAKGAYTGAVGESIGRVGHADGGTLFLDEVGDLPLALQPKLLRFLQDRTYERVGDPVTRYADVRLVAATNRALSQAVAEGAFREDLYYRLNVIELRMPALRERPEDILPLARHWLADLARQHRRPVMAFTAGAEARLRAHGWPGNVRELRNVVERAVILTTQPAIGSDVLPFGAPAPSPTALRVGDPVSLATLEEAHIRSILASQPMLEAAAQQLGIDPATLWRKRRLYGL